MRPFSFRNLPNRTYNENTSSDEEPPRDPPTGRPRKSFRHSIIPGEVSSDNAYNPDMDNQSDIDDPQPIADDSRPPGIGRGTYVSHASSPSTGPALSSSGKRRGRPRKPVRRGRGGAAAAAGGATAGIVAAADIPDVPRPAPDAPRSNEPVVDPATPRVPLLVPVPQVPEVPSVHVWPATLSPFVKSSYSREKGPVCHPGAPIRQLAAAIKSKDWSLTWDAERIPDSPDLIDPAVILPGSPAEHITRLHDPVEFFNAFVSENALDEIVGFTNSKMEVYRERYGDRNKDLAAYRKTNVTELRCFIGCLVMTGIRRDSHMNLTNLFNINANFYKSCFSEKRFQFLIRSIRFDNADQRANVVGDDPMVHIRALWDEVIQNCRNNFIAGPVVTVDEMLTPFRGHCHWRMYIPNKPAKYGLKLFMLNDSRTGYCLNSIPYLGRANRNLLNMPANQLQGEFFTLELLKPNLIDTPGRAVCLDNWFTSLSLAETLLAKGIHMVGTVRSKPNLPSKELVKEMNLDKNESVAIYNHEKNINAVIKKNKSQKTCYCSIHSTQFVHQGRK